MSPRAGANTEGIAFLEPWQALSAERRGLLEAEVAREVPPGHALSGRPMVALAARADQDDVLFEVPGLGYAVVHLAWSGHQASSPSWPQTRTFASLDEWRERVMQPDNDAFSI